MNRYGKAAIELVVALALSSGMNAHAAQLRFERSGMLKSAAG